MPSNFAYLMKFGGTASGDDDEEFNTPRGAATDGRFVWVCDSGNNRIKKLKLNGLAFVAHYGDINVSTGLPISGTGSTGFSSPRDIVYHPDSGLLFISDTGNNRIKLHRARDLAYVNQITGLSAPTGLSANRQYLWCADSGNRRIIRIKLSDLSIEQATGSAGTGNQQLGSDMQQIAYDVHERVLYISDVGNFRVLKWDSHGIMAYRDKITGLSTPYGVAIKDHVLYVGETSSIKVYAAATLALQTTAGSNGTGNENIAGPGYIKTYGEMLLFTDPTNHRLMVWRNYLAERALTPDSDQVIGSGGWFDSPISEIGDTTTAIGADLIDRQRWTKELNSGDNIGWTKQ